MKMLLWLYQFKCCFYFVQGTSKAATGFNGSLNSVIPFKLI